MKSRGSQGQISTRCSSPARRTVRSLPSCCHEPQCPTAVRSLIHGLGDSQKSWVRHGDDIVPYGHRIHRCVIYRGFLKQGYPQIINFFRGFSINHPAIGVSPFMDTPIYMKNIVGICWHIFAESICSIFWGLWDRSINKCWLASWNPFHAARYRIRCAET